VVPLPLENVVRVAEDAAVLDTISGGRVELGVSNGGQPPIAAALGIALKQDKERKKTAYLRALGTLTRMLDGDQAGGAPGQGGALVRLEWPAARGQGGQRRPRREPVCH